MAIDLIPDLKNYPYIAGAHKKGKLIVFVGSGLSALWGCKRWRDMGISLINDCYTSGRIDYWTRESLISKYGLSPRKLITIAKFLLQDEYQNSLKQTLQFSPERKATFSRLFENLYALNAAFVTTNIDDHLSGLFEKSNVHFDPKSFTSIAVKPKNIFHLHGVIHQIDTWVLTIDDYVKRYQEGNFTSFLRSVFFDKSNCFLFIGYGVDEMEIIDYMVEKYGEQTRAADFIHRFYALLPFFQNEEALLGYERAYFDKINMTVIPYAIDTKGYDQIYDIVGKWKARLTDPGDDFYQFSELIERNL